jgi:acetyltransferase-like isoleucine patch superfamily enzyme
MSHPSLLISLWRERDRDLKCFSVAWLKSIAKRLVTLPMLLKQMTVIQSLRASGASIGDRCFFSDIKLVSGSLPLLRVGEESFIGRVEISVHADVKIGNRVCLNDGAKILTATHDIRDPEWKSVSSPITIEDYSWIATNAILLPGVTIGRGAVVGAGAVVTKDVPAGAVAVGNPARLILDQRPESLAYSPTAHLALFTAWRRLSPSKF